MFKKLLFILLFMAGLGVSSAVLLRELVERDFSRMTEAEQEDRVSWVVADLESTFAKQKGWYPEMAVEDAVWALQLGLETRVRDRDGSIVMETTKALTSLSPEQQARLQGEARVSQVPGKGDFHTYPLFLHGDEVGQLEVRFLPDHRNSFFVTRTNHLLAYSAILLGVVACILSVLLARRLSRPIVRLSQAAHNISQGNLSERVEIPGSDELTVLGQSFNQMAHTLHVQNKLRKQVFANLAHELRTPLTIMRGQLEGILDGVIANDESRISLLLEESQRLTNIVASMEEFFQAQASALTLSPADLDIRQIFDNLARNFEAIAIDKEVGIRIDTDDGVMAHADPERLTQILINLVSNSLKATPPGGAITLGGERSPRGCIITVADTGCGIATEDLPLVFERFYRGKDGGLGLGLAIVRELVDAHGGTITVTSEQGVGTTFTILFPDTPKTPQFSTTAP
ncbi:MAG: HAMP domain-containing sensor histidine kinase [Desulfuromonadaceae bacterium]|jgi:two-component system sensor histidine kinase BaeS|nr:HAMP domain-containing sensor histidine kinase [Desulfuromonadaceae bacterium]MDD2733478.1 HAMP domain-containing sensor histidine kinase [Desulfuromonadaceae bacterium]MDD5104352.1 HAMP domain-containing sensor histidine kinase [Desulfuromonadaceae bacterium]MDD5104361.1 HAMP domain-containing sensor histidine kinase [Desulfuromonadaceae bacterium]